MKKEDKSFSIKHEGHLNKNNMIFQDQAYYKLYLELKKENEKLKERRDANKHVSKQDDKSKRISKEALDGK